MVRVSEPSPCVAEGYILAAQDAHRQVVAAVHDALMPPSLVQIASDAHTLELSNHTWAMLGRCEAAQLMVHAE